MTRTSWTTVGLVMLAGLFCPAASHAQFDEIGLRQAVEIALATDPK